MNHHRVAVCTIACHGPRLRGHAELANRLAACTIVACFALSQYGCGRDRPAVQPGPPLALPQAAALVNNNINRITSTLRAVGSVDGHATAPGRGRRSYHLDGVLFYLAPQFFRFDLKALGDTQILIGSNLERYWCFSKTDRQTVCGQHGIDDDLPDGIPARPDQLIDALGLTPIPTSELFNVSEELASGDRARVVQRVAEHSQEVLFLTYSESGRMVVEKEYWLDRYPPRLVRKVIFRDSSGAVEMESTLEEYQRLGQDGPLIPHRMTALWPKLGAKMTFNIRKWTTMPQIGQSAIQFATPAECSDADP